MQKGVASLFVCKNLFIIIYKEEKKFKMKRTKRGMTVDLAAIKEKPYYFSNRALKRLIAPP